LKAVRWNPASHGDPYAYYARLRQETPVLRANIPTRGIGWVVSRYDDVFRVLKDTRFSNDPHLSASPLLFGFGGRFAPRLIRLVGNSMLWTDDPAHARLRGLVSSVFTPRSIMDMDAGIHAIVDSLLDDVAGKGRVDLMSAFALPMPLQVISELLGIPGKTRLTFHHQIMRLIEVSDQPIRRAIRWAPALPKLLRMFEDMIETRRQDPDGKLISQLIAVENNGDHLSRDELVGMIFLLLFAGHETSVNLIGNGLLALMDNPDQLALLRDRPELMDGAVDELLRYTNPVEYGTVRFATEDVEIAGTRIAKGEMVMALLASANRDETAFKNADKLDVTRRDKRHLALGFGLHYCLGAALGRLETRIALSSLLYRFPDLKLAVPRDTIRWRQANGLRGLDALPVELGRPRSERMQSAAE
jgi:cytochrome P450